MEVRTSSGKGKTFFFFQSSQNLENDLFWNKRRGCSGIRFPLQSEINLHCHFTKDTLVNERQQINSLTPNNLQRRRAVSPL
jgi:hypothetical protein